jgi:hypothetical protein
MSDHFHSAAILHGQVLSEHNASFRLTHTGINNVKFIKMSRVLVLCLFPLMPLANMHQFLIYALSFSVLRHFGWLHSVMLNPTYSVFSYGVSFLGVFTKVRKVTISFVMSVHPSVHIEQLSSNWTDFHELQYLSTV